MKDINKIILSLVLALLVGFISGWFLRNLDGKVRVGDESESHYVYYCEYSDCADQYIYDDAWQDGRDELIAGVDECGYDLNCLEGIGAATMAKKICQQKDDIQELVDSCAEWETELSAARSAKKSQEDYVLSKEKKQEMDDSTNSQQTMGIENLNNEVLMALAELIDTEEKNLSNAKQKIIEYDKDIQFYQSMINTYCL